MPHRLDRTICRTIDSYADQPLNTLEIIHYRGKHLSSVIKTWLISFLIASLVVVSSVGYLELFQPGSIIASIAIASGALAAIGVISALLALLYWNIVPPTSGLFFHYEKVSPFCLCPPYLKTVNWRSGPSEHYRSDITEVKHIMDYVQGSRIVFLELDMIAIRHFAKLKANQRKRKEEARLERQTQHEYQVERS